MLNSSKRYNTTPLVSIIIPCYNYEKFVGKSIESALNQTYGNIEVIVIDNGSTDNSLLEIEKFSNNKKVKILRFKNNNPPGKKGSFHVGDAIEESKGEYISMLYADDWYLPNKIAKQVELFDRTHSSTGVVYCHGYRYFESLNKEIEWKMQSVRGYVFKDYLLNGDVVIPISPLVKRYCYDVIGVKNIWTGTEYDILMMSQFFDFDFVDEHLVVMRDHNNNDAKNVHSVYKRLTQFHKIALLEGNARSREGSLVNMRVAHDALADGLAFVTMLDKRHGKEAIFYAIKVHPLIVLRWKLRAAVILIYLPLPFSKYLLNKFGRRSSVGRIECEW